MYAMYTSMTSIKLPKNTDNDLKNQLKESLHKILLEKMGQSNLDNFEPFTNKLNDASSSTRLAISTKNKLKNLMKPSESFNDVINRLIDEHNEFYTKLEYFKKIENDNKNVINYFEEMYKRVNQIFRYHPDLQIEYSYNESKFKSEKRYSFDLQIHKFIYQGKEISEKEAISIIQTISIVRDIRRISNPKDLKKIVRDKETLLDNPFEFVKTKYLIYFKVLYSIVSSNDRHMFSRDNILLDENFWKNVYERKTISEESFDNDVKSKIKKFNAEIKQIETNEDRKIWDFKLK